MKKLKLSFYRICGTRKTLPVVILTKMEFRREMGHLFIGAIEAIKLDGKSQKDFIEQSNRLEEKTLGYTKI